MLALRLCRGILRGLRLFWIIWFGCAAIGLVLVAPLGHQLVPLVLCAAVAPLASLVVHEYGHAWVARRRGATQLSLARAGFSVAVCHEPLDERSNLLVALGGPVASLLAGGVLLTAGWALDSAPQVIVALVVAAGGGSLLPGSHDSARIFAALRHRRTPDPAGEVRHQPASAVPAQLDGAPSVRPAREVPRQPAHGDSAGAAQSDGDVLAK